MKKLGLVGLAVASAVVLAGCSSGGGGGTDDSKDGGSDGTFDTANVELYGGQASYDAMKELYTKAQKDGETEVVVYGAITKDREDLFRQFEKEFPKLKVQTDYLTGAEFFTRINQEIAAGKIMVDAVLSGDTSVTGLKQQGLLAEYLPVLADELPAELLDEDGTFFATTATPFGLLYNTDEVKESEVPHTWQEVLEPKFKGKMAWTDLTSNGPSLVAVGRMLYNDAIDEEWLRALHKQEVHWEGKASSLTSVITTGEYPIALGYPHDYFVNDKKQGAPVGFRLFDEDNYVAINSTGVMKDAPHPSAARLMASWLLTPSAGKTFASLGQYLVMPGADAPEGLPKLDKVPQTKLAPWEEVQAINKKALELNKSIFK